ncbi:MAG: helix-hairpin-helix domain-containing protein [Ferruginibacter sp.]
MQNEVIAEHLSLMAALADIHGDNPFKSKSYAAAAFGVDKLTTPIHTLPPDQWTNQKGIGPSAAQKIQELLTTGRINALDLMLSKTPSGILELLKIKGLGPKKIHTIWKEMDIESPGELLYACQENRLKRFKGFGEKTQKSIQEALEFYQSNLGFLLFPVAEFIAQDLASTFQKLFPKAQWQITGDVRLQKQIVQRLDWLTDLSVTAFEQTLPDFLTLLSDDNQVAYREYKTTAAHTIRIYFTEPHRWGHTLLQSTGPTHFFENMMARLPDETIMETESSIFDAINLPLISPPLRESETILDIVTKQGIPPCIQRADIRGIIHCHSDWSDGSNTIEELASACILNGLEYLVISDHSQSAFYANGLPVNRIQEQHQHINQLNTSLYPFKIFKSIECDILYDGQLDYPDDVLALFDCVIASVHSHLRMTEEKAMERIIRAIKNPYTTILGHPTGRLLLSRPGYPLLMKEIIRTCAAQHVVIELNANPSRLDIDWTHIGQCLSEQVMISINPDAHHIDGLTDIRYGVLAAQKALVNPTHNLSSMTLEAIEAYFLSIKRKKGLV